MKRGLALLLAGLLTIGLAGCSLRPGETDAPESAAESAAPEGAEPSPSVTLRLGFSPDDEAARLSYAVERLGETLPDVAVELTAYVPGEALPELLALPDGELQALAEAGQLAELSAEPAAQALLTRLIPSERARAVGPDGAVFALPQRAAESACFFVNEALFAAYEVEPPRSMEELGAAAAALAARGGGALALCLDDDGAALAFFECFFARYDSRGLNGLLRGESSPYDETVWLAAGELYRLSRAAAVTLLSREDCEALWFGGQAALTFAGERAAQTTLAMLGESAHRLPSRAVAAGEGAGLAVSAAGEHRALAVDAACLLCEYLAEYDLAFGGGACVTLADLPAPGGAPLVGELIAARREAEELTRLTPETAPALSAALAEGVRELLRGTMTPDEFVEYAALTLDS